MPSRWLLDRLSDAYADAVAERDWRLLRPLYHDHALIAAAARPGEHLTIEEFLTELSARRGYLLVGPRTTISFDDSAGAIQTWMRVPDANGSLRTVDRTLLITFVDDLVYRQVNVVSVERAAQIYARYGLPLAMDADGAETAGAD